MDKSALGTRTQKPTSGAQRGRGEERKEEGRGQDSRPRAEHPRRLVGRIVLVEALPAFVQRRPGQKLAMDGAHDGAAVVEGPPEGRLIHLVVERRPACPERQSARRAPAGASTYLSVDAPPSTVSRMSCLRWSGYSDSWATVNWTVWVSKRGGGSGWMLSTYPCAHDDAIGLCGCEFSIEHDGL
ncbi:hypothetical protein G6O67_004402 [Ophiocordyceps sinensis]|uniref:Uncharacterized protein n=1 Tax=Ophiocordyceps sinensis TaxID=72228 RepID=A0A8H4LYX5_9HYPO|nr:hypothetical protein G6O67_004402 [Ophiocordyceps sinensis]